MSLLSSELYQEMILDHNKNPRNFGELANYSHHQEGFNPICGDHVHLFVKMEGDKISAITHTGVGCAICKASTSMMTEAVKNKTTAEALELFQLFHQLLTKTLAEDKKKLGKLQVFSGIWQYPARVKCAGLSWHTLKALLSNSPNQIVKTEE